METNRFTEWPTPEEAAAVLAQADIDFAILDQERAERALADVYEMGAAA
jgi:hypothetical protein